MTARQNLGQTITLSAGQPGSKTWWITKNSSGRTAANHRICLCAIQGALCNDDRNDIVVVHWAEPPDASIPQEFHSGLPTVADWLNLT
jgi:hypothetical protein